MQRNDVMKRSVNLRRSADSPLPKRRGGLGSAAIVLLAAATLPRAVAAQALINQPVRYAPKPGEGVAPGAPAESSSARSWLSQVGLNVQLGQAQLGAAANVYRLDLYGTPKCVSQPDGQSACTARTALSLQLSSSIVDPIVTSLSSVRQYLVSQEGAPITAKLAFLQRTSKRGDVRQTWIAYQVSASARALPVAGAAGQAQVAGALSVGGTLELNLEFDATRIGPAETAVYPGTLYLSVTPSVIAPFGGEVRTAIFAGTHPTTALVGIDYRVGFELRGSNPTSFGLMGTLGLRGFKDAQSSVGVGVSKALAGQ